MQIAINQVLRGLGNSRIHPRHAGVYFYGLQIAARLARKSDEKPAETVRDLNEEPDGEVLAPEKSICEPPADCLHCAKRDYCEDFDFWSDDVEELEARLEDEENEEDDQDDEQEGDADEDGD